MQPDQELDSDRDQTPKEEAVSNYFTPVTTPVFVMIPKLFSESVCVRPDGPRSKVVYNSTCSYSSECQFRTSAELVSRLEPRYYVSTVKVDGEVELITYHERVVFLPCVKAREFSESVFSFPKRKVDNFITTLTYDPEYETRHYVSKIEFIPAQKLRIAGKAVPAPPVDCCRETGPADAVNACNGVRMHEDNVRLVNGTS